MTPEEKILVDKYISETGRDPRIPVQPKVIKALKRLDAERRKAARK